jgi:hypothetical protein
VFLSNEVGEIIKRGLGSNEAEPRPKNHGLSVGISGYLFAGFLGLTGEACTNARCANAQNVQSICNEAV